MAGDELILVRQRKAARLRERGEDPFANDVTDGDPPLSALADVRARFAEVRGADGRYPADAIEPLRFRLAGRILFMRSFGGMSFLRLRDRSGELQLVCEQATLALAYARLDDLDLGDIVEAEGTAMATKKGELSIHTTRIRLLTKAYRPLPTKTSFTDVEQRYRMRYVDLVANPEVSKIFVCRSIIVKATRKFLDARGFLEVETPSMHTLVGGAVAKPFSTHHNALDMDLFMRIAPELHLKRLVVGGFERVYELARCYRNEGISTRHNPEFTMLEYYQAYASYQTLMTQTEEMLRFVDREIALGMPVEHAAWSQARPFSFARFERVPLQRALRHALDAADLPHDVALSVDRQDAPIKQWAQVSKARGREIDWAGLRAAINKCSSPGERLFVGYEYIAEPFLTRDYREGDKSAPVLIIDYPFEVSPLARRKDADPSLVDRFELFIDGREVCNAFSELNDPADQAERFRAQVEQKQRGAQEAMDYDHDYIRALEYGMPPSAGFGMGIDRLTMMLTCAPSIRDVILFPLLRPETRG